MITKDQLKKLDEFPEPEREVRYTIGGPIEAAVHSSLENERHGQRVQGHRIMKQAVSDFRNNMAFQSRNGLARGQFCHVAPDLNPSNAVDRNRKERDR